MYKHAHANQTCAVGGRRTGGGREEYRNVCVWREEYCNV